MNLFVKVLFVIIVSGFVSGCGTIHTQLFHVSNQKTEILVHMGAPPNLVYGGSTMDLYLIALGPLAIANGEVLGILVIPIFLADLPLSFTADTLILPITIYQQIQKSHDESLTPTETNHEGTCCKFGIQNSTPSNFWWIQVENGPT